MFNYSSFQIFEGNIACFKNLSCLDFFSFSALLFFCICYYDIPRALDGDCIFLSLFSLSSVYFLRLGTSNLDSSMNMKTYMPMFLLVVLPLLQWIQSFWEKLLIWGSCVKISHLQCISLTKQFNSSSYICLYNWQTAKKEKDNNLLWGVQTPFW